MSDQGKFVLVYLGSIYCILAPYVGDMYFYGEFFGFGLRECWNL